MNAKEHITGIILAGGKSKRMGRDKALVPYKGKMFLEHVIDALKPLVNDMLIVSDHSEYDRFGILRTEDLIKNAGPLAGLYSGLYHSKTENNLVVSCDVPLMNTSLLQQLMDENEPSLDMVQFQSGDKTMPLIALYKKRILPSCWELLESGERRLRTFVDTLQTKTIVLDKEVEHHAVNINTEQDLNELKNEFDH
ncbi:molybdenum cofactor guanylyltransferase [Aureisphaera galaxeae]|uniref:molybdenum cofactor guanylyltransferase n=1 Tax=Aureisphaera galaxeae TaxID=1538023 RepID=UPI0023501899|nr:molybdenum cofactor guanylyltransferase [Aureisphaera galaxeae]MDC8002477.1 molybdenum cofactor guanylyltransferase [Aureisphaera galaxeae]